jgi:opacity protein-like surface antigen
MTRRLLTLLVVSALAAAPSALSAQLSTGLSIAGGISLPKGEGSSDTESGFNGALGLNIGAPLLPVGFRLEGAYNGWNAKSSSLPAGYSGNANIISGTANATVGLGLPYLIGGLGYYRVKSELKGGALASTNTQNAMGYNVGAGVRFPLGVMSTFVEARYHKMMGDKNKGADASYIPITFGIQF